MIILEKHQKEIILKALEDLDVKLGEQELAEMRDLWARKETKIMIDLMKKDM
jgi:hypothetical protein